MKNILLSTGLTLAFINCANAGTITIVNKNVSTLDGPVVLHGQSGGQLTVALPKVTQSYTLRNVQGFYTEITMPKGQNDKTFCKLDLQVDKDSQHTVTLTEDAAHGSALQCDIQPPKSKNVKQ